MEKAIPASLRGAVRKLDRKRQKEVLPAPNAVVDQKAARIANYEVAKADVGKWEGAVMRNRLADRLVFPLLPSQRVRMPESNEERRHRGNLMVKDALERAQKGSDDLDAKIFSKMFPGKAAERFLAKTSAVAAEDEEPSELAEKPLQERLAELRVLKVKQGQIAAKLRQRAKIRSKNFHRHLKRQKIAQEANELKALSSSDPEAFKAKLDALQKRRIEERMTQRHRQGGRWARQAAAFKKGGPHEGLDTMQEIAHQLLRPTASRMEEEEEEEGEEEDGGWITVTRSGASNSGVDAAWNANRASGDLPGPLNRMPAPRSSFSLPQDVQNVEMEQEEEEGMEADTSAPVAPLPSKMKPRAAGKTPAIISLSGPLPALPGSSDPSAVDPGADLEAELEELVGDQEELEAEFEAEKRAQAAEEQPKDLDTFLPGWNTWTGPGVDADREAKKRERFRIRAPQVSRRDADNRRVIITERRLGRAYRRHQVKEIPFPFTDAESWEAAVARPVGRLWTTESSHRQLIRPRVTSKQGQIIAPLSKDHLLRRGQDGKAPKRLQGKKDRQKNQKQKAGRRDNKVRK